MSVFAPAVARYRKEYKREWRQEVEVPDLPATIHVAYVTRAPTGDEPFFGSRFSEWNSLCGKRIKVLLPGPVDEDATDACRTCVERWRYFLASDDEPEEGWVSTLG